MIEKGIKLRILRLWHLVVPLVDRSRLDPSEMKIAEQRRVPDSQYVVKNTKSIQLPLRCHTAAFLCLYVFVFLELLLHDKQGLIDERRLW